MLIATLFAVSAVGSASASPLLEYVLTGQWPPTDWPLDTLAGRPSGLAVARDGTVYLADGTVNRITVMGPDGTWLKEFGNSGTGPERLGLPERLEIDEDSNRLFVADTDSNRIVVYDLEGHYVESWPDILAADLALAPDGRLWVADVFTTQVRAFTTDGEEVFAFGERGSGEGKFRQLSGLSVAPSGDLYVGDRNGTRVQVFRPDQGGPSDANYRLVRTMDLTDEKYRYTTGGGPREPGGRGPGGGMGPGMGMMTRSCSARDMAALDDDTLLVYPCLVSRGEVTFLTTGLRTEGIVGFFQPYVDVEDGLYYSMAMYTSNPENPRDPDATRAPAVAKYVDGEFRVLADAWLLAEFDTERFRQPDRLDVHPNGSVYVSEFHRVFQYDLEGEYQRVLPRETFPTDAVSVTLQFATGDGTADGVIGLGTCHSGANDLPCLGHFLARTRDYRGEPYDYLEPVWTTTLPSQLSAPVVGQRRGAQRVNEMHYDAVNDLILILDNDDQELLAYQRLGRGRKEIWALGGTAQNSLYADLGSSLSGEIYVLDVLRDEIQVRSAEGDLLRRVDAPSDSWRVAGGPEGTMFVLTSFGEVVRMSASGEVEARFDVRPNAKAQARNLSDLSVAGDGRVFVADRQASLVSVFAPTGSEAPVRAGETCSVRGDKTADPASIAVGEAVRVTLGIAGSCGSVEEPTSILLLVNTKNSSAFDTARQVLALADFRRHNVGLMGYYVNTLFKVRWTQDASKLIAGLEQLNAGGGSESSERNALTEAHRELSLIDGRAVVVLIGAQYCVKAESTDCQEQHDAEEIAGELRSEGYRVVVVNGSTDAGLLATSDLDVLSVHGGDLSGAVPVYQRVASLVKPDFMLQSVSVADVIPQNMVYVEGSSSPAAHWDPSSRTLQWDVADVPYGVTSLTYDLRPQDTGRWPTNVEAYADYTDGWDGTGRVAFPVPEVEVIGLPTPTPTTTATSTAIPTATPSPGPTHAAQPVYLPIAYLRRCTVTRMALDIALVIDASSSMSAPTDPGGPTKMEAARAAAVGFIEQLGACDRAAVVAFDEEASVRSELTSDLQTVAEAIRSLETGYGTRIDLGLTAGAAALEGRRTDASAAIVLLTDGRPSIEGEDVLAAAQAAAGDDVIIYTIGLGADVDGDLLKRVAGAPERYFEAPATAELRSIYLELARELIVCP